MILAGEKKSSSFQDEQKAKNFIIVLKHISVFSTSPSNRNQCLFPPSAKSYYWVWVPHIYGLKILIYMDLKMPHQL